VALVMAGCSQPLRCALLPPRASAPQGNGGFWPRGERPRTGVVHQSHDSFLGGRHVTTDRSVATCRPSRRSTYKLGGRAEPERMGFSANTTA
jgi:hypothetical protein